MGPALRAVVLLCCVHIYIFFPPGQVYGQTSGSNTAAVSGGIAGSGSTAGYVTDILRKKSIPFEVRPLLQNYGGFGTSVHVRLAAGPGSSGTFVLAVPLDSEFAVAAALAFIDAAKAQTSADINIDLLIAFLGNEKSALGRPEYSNIGLRDLINLPEMPETWTVVYLDSGDSPDQIQISHGNINYLAPLQMVKPLPDLFKSFGIPFDFRAKYNELYKLDLIKGSGELALLQDGEIFGIKLNGISGSSEKTIEPAVLANMLLEYAKIMRRPAEEPDQHYTILPVSGGNYFFISEKAAVLILVISTIFYVILILIFSAVHRVRLISRIYLFIKKGWVFALFLPLMVLIIRGVGFFCGFIYWILKVQAPNMDFWGWILNVFIAISLFNVLSHVLDSLHFSRKAELYGISAIFITGLGVLVSAALDLTYAVLFMWAFLFCFIGAVTKKPWLVILTILLIPLRTFGAIRNIYESGGLPAHLFLIQNGIGSFIAPENWIAAFEIAVLCLPIMLLLKRAFVLVNPGSKKFIGRPRPRKIRPAFVVWLGIFGLLLVIITLNALLTPGEPQPVYRTIDLSNKQSAESIPPDIFKVSLAQTAFQESLIVNIRLQSSGNPVLFDLFLGDEGNDPPFVYSAPVPAERIDDNTVRFLLGEDPPNPLVLEIVLKNEDRGFFEADAYFNDAAAGNLPGNLLCVKSGPIPLTR